MDVRISNAQNAVAAAKAAAEQAKQKADQAKTDSETKSGTANQSASAADSAKNTATQSANAAESAKNTANASAQASAAAQANASKEAGEAQSAANEVALASSALQSLYSLAAAAEDPSTYSSQIASAEAKLREAEAKAAREQSEADKAKADADAAAQKAEQDSAKAEEAAAKAEQDKAAADEAAAKAEQDKAAAEEAAANSEAAAAEASAAEEALKAAEAELAKIEAEVAAEESKKSEETEGVEDSEFVPMSEADALKEGYTIIRTPEDLAAMAANPSGKYIMMGNVDLEGVDWTPIGTEDSPFTGVFNGNGYVISNLTINANDGVDTQNVGFFAVTDGAELSNIKLENATIVTPETYTKGCVGALVGLAKGTTFENIEVQADVTGHQKVGGVVGAIVSNGDEAAEVYFKDVHADVNIDGSFYMGGIVGHITDLGNTDVMFENCSATGNIDLDRKSAGGLVGEAYETIVSFNKCTSSVNLNGDEDASRIGGFIGNINGAKVSFCNSKFAGSVNGETNFKGSYYGYYMNDARVSVFELSAGIPANDVLNIDGIEGLTPVYDEATGKYFYEATVSTLPGLDKLVAMVRKNPDLAEVIKFNVNFDFEAMDGAYDHSVYAQYGVVQHLYEDEETGKTYNDVYIDNEIDTETTFHYMDPPAILDDCEIILEDDCRVRKTMVEGLFQNIETGEYMIQLQDGTFEPVTLQFYYENQEAIINKRLSSEEVKARNQLTMMVWKYQEEMYSQIRAEYGLEAGATLPSEGDPEAEYYLWKQENGQELTPEEKLALEVYQLDSKIIDIVDEAIGSQGCGMGGDYPGLEDVDSNLTAEDIASVEKQLQELFKNM